MNGPSPLQVKPPNPSEKRWMLNAIDRAVLLVELPDINAGLCRARNHIAELPERRECLECGFLESNGYCMKWEAVVPEEWRAIGCGQWEELIPF